MGPTTEAWTPYGLEAIRVAHVRRRRIVTAIAALLLMGGWMLMFDSTTSREITIFANGEEQRPGGIKLDVPDSPPQKDPKVTVGISPGRITHAAAGSDAPGGLGVQRANLPEYSRAPALNWMYYVMMVGPWALLGSALWFLGRRRGKYDEINFGVHKGAMPLELISTDATKRIFTGRMASKSVFGKPREEYLPPHLAIERVPQEGDDA